VSGYDETLSDLPVLRGTPESWARLAVEDLATFLADHAVCEQQAALTALNLAAHYPDDDELVRHMAALAAEEVSHLRRVLRLLHGRGLHLARRRPNPFVNELRTHIRKVSEPELKVDRLLLGALIEARSCERFARLLPLVERKDPEVAALLRDLGPAEKRHWEMFHGLAAREVGAEELEQRWRTWLHWEQELMDLRGRSPTVHG